jgi:hypothetical protein
MGPKTWIQVIFESSQHLATIRDIEITFCDTVSLDVKQCFSKLFN